MFDSRLVRLSIMLGNGLVLFTVMFGALISCRVYERRGFIVFPPRLIARPVIATGG